MRRLKDTELLQSASPDPGNEILDKDLKSLQVLVGIVRDYNLVLDILQKERLSLRPGSIWKSFKLDRRLDQSLKVIVEVLLDRDAKNLEIGGVVVVGAKVKVP